MRPHRLPLALVAAALLLVSCDEAPPDADVEGADGDGSDGQLQTLIAEDLVASQQDGAISFDEPQADCVAAGMLDRFGGEQLRDWGYDEETDATPEGDLTIEDGDQRLEAWALLGECVDVTEQIATILAAGGSLDEEEAACVAERYVDSDVAAHAVFGPGDEEVNEQVDALLEDAVETCS